GLSARHQSGVSHPWISPRPQRPSALLTGNSMPASIILSNLSLSTPDGRPLLSDIDLTFAAERTGLVGRNGVGKTTLLASISGEHVPQSGRILVNATVGLLRQDVQPLAGVTVAD